LFSVEQNFVCRRSAPRGRLALKLRVRERGTDYRAAPEPF